MCQKQRHFDHDGTVYLEHLCLLQQNTVVATKPPHVRFCWTKILAQTTSGWCTPMPFLLHRCGYTCRYPQCLCRGKLLPSQLLLLSLDYYWEAFWTISFMQWPWASVKNFVQCFPQRHALIAENKQDRTASVLALTFQWPPIPLQPVPCSTLLAAPF